MGLRFELRASHLQSFYCLSHTSGPFCSSYFGDGGLKNSFSKLALNCNPPHLSLLNSWNYRREPPVISFCLFSQQLTILQRNGL
jgi:hypothetical protein